MKDNVYQDLDDIIKKAVHEMVDGAEPSPVEESWARFEKKLQKLHNTSDKQNRTTAATGTNRPFPKKLAIAAGIVLVIGALLPLAFPVEARALGKKIVATLTVLLHGTQANEQLRYGYGEGDAPGRELIKEIESSPELVVSLAEAQSLSPFPLPTPEYVPAGYKISEVRFQELIKPFSIVQVTILYEESNDQYFRIVAKNPQQEYSFGQGYDTDDCTAGEFMAGDNSGRIYLFKNGKVKTIWFNHGIVYQLESNMDKDEVLKIIESI